MVAILFRFLNLDHRFEIDNFVVELILVDHVLTILRICVEQRLNYFLVVHHCHPKENTKRFIEDYFSTVERNSKGQKKCLSTELINALPPPPPPVLQLPVEAEYVRGECSLVFDGIVVMVFCRRRRFAARCQRRALSF